MIIPARYCTRYDPAYLGEHCLEDLDPSFRGRVSPGDIIVAGNNFGCGSSRENAPLAIKGAGVSCVIAKSFARIFYRNAINVGLPIFISPQAVEEIQEGDLVEVDAENGTIRLPHKGLQFNAEPYPPEIMEIINAGGVIGYVRKQLQDRNNRKELKR